MPYPKKSFAAHRAKLHACRKRMLHNLDILPVEEWPDWAAAL